MNVLKNSAQLFALIPVILRLFTGCTVTPENIAGTGSQAGNGMVVAAVSNPDGSPAGNVRIYIRDKGFLKDTAAIGTQKLPDAVTDSKGRFEIDSVDPGTYFIEFYDGVSNALLIECVKESATVQDSGITDLGAVSLQPIAAFSGLVERENIPDSVAVYIQLYGLEHARKVDLSGAFSFDYVPPGMLTLRIFSSDFSLGVVDSEAIKVDPAENLDAGTFILPFEYWRDTLVVRAILDSNGKFTMPVAAVVIVKKGRVAELNLTHKGISKIPPVIGKLRLTHLHLGENFIDFLPPQIGNISSLIHLGLMRNKISGLPGTVRNLKKLKHIDLSFNVIDLLHPDFTKLSSLIYCNISENRLARLPKYFGNLTELKYLDLSYNKIEILPFSIMGLTGFDFLSVNFNDLLNVPPDLEEWLNTHSTDKEWKVTQGIGEK